MNRPALRRSRASVLALTAASIGAAPAAAGGSFDLSGALSAEDRAARAAFAPAEPPRLEKALTIVDLSADARPPERDPIARESVFDREAFKSDPEYEAGYDPDAQIEIYGGKRPVDIVVPPVEIGRSLYGPGEIGEGIAIFGDKNRLTPQLLVFGDARTAVAYNKQNNGDEIGQIAGQLNLFANLQLTGTERILMFWQPIQDGGQFSRFEFAGPDRDPDADPEIELGDEPTTLFFEGDAGAIIAGLTDEYLSVDIPFAFGRMPLLLQNGVWLEDAFIGGAVTIPAKNSPTLGITNYDVTFFAGSEEVTSDAFLNGAGARDDDGARIFGVAGFFDVAEGYAELGAAWLDDRETGDGDFSYLNLTGAFTKRYSGMVSNSTRIIANVLQDPGPGRAKTADGVLLISENAFITSKPLTLTPYANFWIGKDTPQSAARAGAAGGVLRNVGLSFESDNITGYPTLDPTGRDTLGGAVGVQYLFGLDQQLVGEVATVIPWDGGNGPAQGNEYAVSARYQIPVTNQVILRTDAIYGVKESAEDVFGARFEVRVKF